MSKPIVLVLASYLFVFVHFLGFLYMYKVANPKMELEIKFGAGGFGSKTSDIVTISGKQLSEQCPPPPHCWCKATRIHVLLYSR